MRTINQVLDRAQTVQKVRSDYKLGLCLGIGASSISSYRLGKSLPDEKACQKLATAIGEKPDLLLVEMQAQRSKDDETRALWSSIANRLQKGLSSIKMLLVITTISIAASALPALASVYCAGVFADLAVYTSWKVWRRLRTLFCPAIVKVCKGLVLTTTRVTFNVFGRPFTQF